MKTLGQRLFPSTARPPELPAPPVERTAEEEGYVIDDRVLLRPSDHVQKKLLKILPSRAIPVSCVHNHRETGRNAR